MELEDTTTGRLVTKTFDSVLDWYHPDCWPWRLARLVWAPIAFTLFIMIVLLSPLFFLWDAVVYVIKGHRC